MTINIPNVGVKKTSHAATLGDDSPNSPWSTSSQQLAFQGAMLQKAAGMIRWFHVCPKKETKTCGIRPKIKWGPIGLTKRLRFLLIKTSVE